jgi:hypothetical protein
VALVAGWFGLSGRSSEDAKTVTTKGPVVVAADGGSQGVVKYLVPVTRESVKSGATYFRVEGGVLREVKGGESNCPPDCYTLENECNPDPCKYRIVISMGAALKGGDGECPPHCAFSAPQECPPACATGLPDDCPPNCTYEVKEAGK